jgi:prepilin-type N-terminal cleavage/methylation domain-containing protein/prepilin-type processing-associated H-X9-DG protein
MCRNRGFTLIELLVVVAIIAILAGILFPVFAQAREKARQSACLSNFKQAAAAITMYTQDYDEQMVPLMYVCCAFNMDVDRTWPQLVAPYIKNWAIHNCPSDPGADDSLALSAPAPFLTPKLTPASPQHHKEYKLGLTTDLGYNYLHLSPISALRPRDAAGNVIQYIGVSLASIQRPGNCLMLADSIWDRNPQTGQPTGGGNWWIEAPSWWYSGSSGWKGGWKYTDKTGWLQYGGTWPRHHEMVNVAFVDGHIKPLRTGQIIAGVDPRTAVVYDRDAFIWGR